MSDSSSLVVSHTATKVHNGLTKARITNPTVQDISLQKIHLGEFYSVDDFDIQPLHHASVNMAAATSYTVAPPVLLNESSQRERH